MLEALADRAIVPDLLVGTSVGALNAAFLAAGPSPRRIAELADIWRGVRRTDVFPTSVRSLLGAVRGKSSALVDPRPLRRLLERALSYERIEDAPWPLAVVATEVETGREVLLTRGSVVDAVMASASIPAVFPPVRVDGHVLMDGGVVNNTPITAAQDLGASVAYVLPTGYACALPEAPRSALGMALHAVSIGLQQRLIAEVVALQGTMTLRVAPPLCPVSVSPTDFDHASELMAAARSSTRRWLDRPAAVDQERVLALHAHRPDPAQVPASRRPTSGGRSRHAAAS
jgi:NTE family protein